MHFDEPPQIRAERLVLRQFCETDAPRLATLAGARRIADTTISVPHPYSESDADDAIRRFRCEWAARRGVHFAICTNDDPAQFVGYVGLRDVDYEHLVGELSFWMSEPATGRGYTTEAARAVLAFGFTELGLNRVCAYHMARNSASAKILANIGMREEGRLRQRVRKWDVFEDVLAWAIVRGEWVC